MNTIYDGPLFSHYGQCYLTVGDAYDVTEDYRAGQQNGLLGTAVPTLLFIHIGHHTGTVSLRIELHSSAPEIDNSWEEIVEAPFTMPPNESLTLSECCGDARTTFTLPAGDYRVRYCAKDFGVHDEKTTEERELDPLTESYLLCFWQAPRSQDAIIKCTRQRAKYWHDVAQGMAY